LTTLHRILGDYAQGANPDTFLVKKHDPGINNDVARMVGARFVSTRETEQGRHLATAKIKELTGGDPVTARFLRRENFDFIPVLKLWFATNHRPVIRDTSDGIWRRVLLLPFTVTIPEHEKDPTLPDRLLQEAAGILAWAVEGCLLWQQTGLQAPALVTEATAAYRQEQDTLTAFLQECCLLDRTYTAELAAAFLTYTLWAGNGNEDRPLGKTQFKKALAERGYPAWPGRQNKAFIHGLGLRANEYSTQPETGTPPGPVEPSEVSLVSLVSESPYKSGDPVSHRSNIRENTNQTNQTNPPGVELAGAPVEPDPGPQCVNPRCRGRLLQPGYEGLHCPGCLAPYTMEGAPL
jgi:putative DNA primase/helicase